MVLDPICRETQPVVRVLIVSSVRLYREGLAQILERTDGFSVAGMHSDGRDASGHLTQFLPDVVLLDMATPESHEAAREILDLVPAIPIVALGVRDTDAEVLACAESGIAGYVTRDGSLEELITTIESAARGELVCSPRIAGSLLRRLAELAADRVNSAFQSHLTTRECEIAHFIQEDLSNKEIANRLGIEVATVKNHVHNLLEKLNIHRRTEVGRLLGHTRR
jgi:two-component system nitrate/nitrite response regulator NarL